MGRHTRSSSKSDASQTSHRKRKSCTKLTPATEIANVNTNQAMDTDVRKSVLDKVKAAPRLPVGDKKGKARQRSVVAINEDISMEVDPQHTQAFEFEENGEIVRMEINDGGAAEEEFASEDETEEGQLPDKEVESDDEMQGEHSSDEDEQSSDGKNTSDDEPEPTPMPSPLVKWKLKKKERRQSLENWLDTMSSVLLVVKDILMKNGLADSTVPKAGTSGTNKTNRGKQSNPSTSETTIYRNVLNKIDQSRDETWRETENETIVDSEITFKVRQEECNHPPPTEQLEMALDKKRDSSSSEDRMIDTSDELMDIDIDFNDKFIADFQKEAATQWK